MWDVQWVMKTAMLLVILAAVGLAGCNPGLTSVTDPTVYVDPAVPMESALAGMNMWRDGVGVNWVLTEDRRAADVSIVAVTDGCIESDGTTWGGYDDDGSTAASLCMGNFHLELPSEVASLNGTIAHELGHVMHLGHLPDAELALMNNRDPGSLAAITDADKRAWHAIWGALP